MVSSVPLGKDSAASATLAGVGRATLRARVDADLRAVIADVLRLAPGQADAFTAESGLFGELPELDSMAVADLLTTIEDQLGIVIDDEEVDGEMLETYGALLAFVEGKLVNG